MERSLPVSKSCFVCGVANSHGLKLRLYPEAGRVRTTFSLPATSVGFTDRVHGGVVATVLDEAMAWAAAVVKQRFGVCASMTVRYKRPVAVAQRLHIEAELVNDRRRTWEVSATLRDDAGTTLVTAEGTYMPLSDDQMRHAVEDLLVDDESLSIEQVFPGFTMEANS